MGFDDFGDVKLFLWLRLTAGVVMEVGFLAGGRASRIEGVRSGRSLLLEVLSPQQWLLGADFASFRARGTRDRLRAMGSSSSTHRIDPGSGTSSATNSGKSSVPNSGPPSAQESSSNGEPSLCHVPPRHSKMWRPESKSVVQAAINL